MYYVVYVSTATRSFNDEELMALLRQSQESNTRRGITGILLYKETNFIQVLEGPEAIVRERVARIECDPRHVGFLTLLQGHSETPLFPEWSMGFIPAAKLCADDQAAVNGFWKPNAMDSIGANPTGIHPALKLLLSFKRYMR